MKLLRYGDIGREKPGILDADDTIRDLSAHVDDITGATLDAAGLDDDEAISVGVPLAGLRRGLMILGGGLATLAVVVVGPIAFVGLLAPHAARLLVGASHRQVVPGAALSGAVKTGADGAFTRFVSPFT